jgi:hypothetical protein
MTSEKPSSESFAPFYQYLEALGIYKKYKMFLDCSEAPMVSYVPYLRTIVGAIAGSGSNCCELNIVLSDSFGVGKILEQMVAAVASEACPVNFEFL